MTHSRPSAVLDELSSIRSTTSSRSNSPESAANRVPHERTGEVTWKASCTHHSVVYHSGRRERTVSSAARYQCVGGARECVNYVGDYAAERVVSHLGFQVTMEELGETWQQQQQ